MLVPFVADVQQAGYIGQVIDPRGNQNIIDLTFTMGLSQIQAFTKSSYLDVIPLPSATRKTGSHLLPLDETFWQVANV